MRKSDVRHRDEGNWQELSKRIKRVEVLLNIFITVLLLVLVPLVFYVYHADIHKPYDYDFTSLQRLRQEDTIQESAVEGNLMSGVDANVANNSPPSGGSLSALLNNTSEEEDVKEIPAKEEKQSIVPIEMNSNRYEDILERRKERRSESNRRNWHVEKERYNKPKKDNKKSSDLETIPGLTINGDEIDNNFHRILQAKAGTETTPCDKTLLRIEIRLDDYPNETSWDLVDETSGDIIIAQNFTETEINDDIMITDDSFRLDFAEPRAVYDFEKCIEPGPYTFTIYDSFWDGINCGHPVGCFKLFLNDQLAVRGTHFNSDSEHSFDTSKTDCNVGFKFMLHIDPVYFNSGITWKLFNKKIFTESVLSQELATNGKITYVQCLQLGLYSFDIFEGDVSIDSCGEEGPCYEAFIDDQKILTGEESFGHIYHEFYVSKEGKAREQHCYKFPKLSPANHLNKFVFDESISKTLSVITSLSSMEMLQDIFSPQYRAACWVIYDDVYHLSGLSPFLVERYALAVFFFSTKQNIENLQLRTCSVEMNNVKCNDQNHIMKLDYWKPQFPLKGSIPSEVGLLLDLESIDLGYNKLQGSIPNQIARLTKLKVMNLDFNDLTGTIPWQIGELQRLQEIVLEGNNLHGSIPVGFGQCSRLQKLKIRTNKLNGALPSDLYDCVELKVLQVGDNALNGTISSKIGNFLDLTWLSIEGNKFTGSLPKEVWSLPSLEEFNADFNQLTGSLPEEARQLTALEWLDVDSNLFEGSVPDIFNEMPNLMHLDLSNNRFTGQFPDSLWNLQYEEFFVFENDLVGEVPSSFCDKVSVEMHVDNSNWFALNPKVKCDCCDDSTCYVWDDGFSPSRPCPQENIHEQDFVGMYKMYDEVSNFTFVQRLGSNIDSKAHTCLSPFGCYRAEWTLDADMNTAEQDIGKCEEVDICGNIIGIEDSRRKALNHLTQFIPPDLSKLNNESIPFDEALCWIMTKDKLREFFSICDGTLLQRFILFFFYRSQRFELDLDSLSTNSTCDWPGITCSKNKFVTGIDLAEKNLSGTIISELGYLTTLERINLSNNSFVGTIDPFLYENLLSLEKFDLSSNAFEGDIPIDLLAHPDLKYFNISNNKFVGTLSNDVVFSRKLETFDVENNLFQGTVPNNLLQVRTLETFCVARNNFGGTIPRGIGNMPNIQVVKFDQNIFEGSIPAEIFESNQIRVLQLQDNRLTGSIPVQIGNLVNASTLTMSHNLLKGTIPKEMEKLKKLHTVHFHQNRLTGNAPFLEFSEETKKNEIYITDCGDPNYLLDEPIVCETCSMCCNSMQRCQLKNPLDFPVWSIYVMVILLPFFFTALLGLALQLRDYCTVLIDSREPLTIYNDDSIYCFILSENVIAMGLYFATVIVQVLLFALYLDASRFDKEDTDWLFSYRCLGNNFECKVDKSDNFLGAGMFFIVTLLYLGADIVMSFLQIRKSVALYDKKLLFSGVVLLALTSLATLTSFRYNTALAEKNTDWITNSIILLFVNELDEQVLSVVEAIAPHWTEKILQEVELNMASKLVTKQDANNDILTGQAYDGQAYDDALPNNQYSERSHHSDFFKEPHSRTDDENREHSYRGHDAYKETSFRTDNDNRKYTYHADSFKETSFRTDDENREYAYREDDNYKKSSFLADKDQREYGFTGGHSNDYDKGKNKVVEEKKEAVEELHEKMQEEIQEAIHQKTHEEIQREMYEDIQQEIYEETHEETQREMHEKIQQETHEEVQEVPKPSSDQNY